MDQDNFWDVFHKAWGESKAREGYNKKAWMYVQLEVQSLLEEQKEERARVDREKKK